MNTTNESRNFISNTLKTKFGFDGVTADLVVDARTEIKTGDYISVDYENQLPKVRGVIKVIERRPSKGEWKETTPPHDWVQVLLTN